MDDDRMHVSFGTDDPRMDIEVERACDRCYGSQVNVRELQHMRVVSPEGTAHAQGDKTKTFCGIPITDEWWVAE